MFQRVQLGMPLKEGEKLQSIGSEWAAWIGTICRKFVEVEDGLQDVLDWGTNRGKAFQCVATVVSRLVLCVDLCHAHRCTGCAHS
jgi:hypothetical protein